MRKKALLALLLSLALALGTVSPRLSVKADMSGSEENAVSDRTNGRIAWEMKGAGAGMEEPAGELDGELAKAVAERKESVEEPTGETGSETKEAADGLAMDATGDGAEESEDGNEPLGTDGGNGTSEAGIAVGHAEDDIAGGNDQGDGWVIDWAIDADGKLTVNGTGDCMNPRPWEEYAEQIKSAEIDVTGAVIVSGLFSECSNLTEVDLSGFDTRNVTDMDGMFERCSSLTSLDLSSFDTGNVMYMSWMFARCSNLTSLDLSGFDTSNVEDMGWMFLGCSSLTSLDLSGFDTRNVTNMDEMFANCSSLTNLDVSGLDTGNVTSMQRMFMGCSSLTSLDVSGFDTGNAEYMIEMFRDCSSLTSLDLSSFDMGNAPEMGMSFVGCQNLKDIKSPLNMKQSISLPLPAVGTAIWHRLDNGAEVTKLPQNLNYSVELSRVDNGQPEPTTAPTTEPSPEPTTAPTTEPSPEPTTAPTTEPSPEPTTGPSPEPTTAPTQAPTQDTKAPSLKGEYGKEGWEAIKAEAADAADGKGIAVDMNGTSVVPGDVIESIRGRDVTLTFDLGNGIAWSVNGRNVTAEHANDVDFSVQIGTSAIPQNLVENVAGNRQAMQISLAHNGDFGYSAVLTVRLGSANAEWYANLFYYNRSTGKLEFVMADQINGEGIAEFTFTHASDYLIVIRNGAIDINSNGSSNGNTDGGGDGSADSGISRETGIESPRTGEFGTAGGTGAAATRNDGNSQNLLWLILVGIATAAVGTAAFRIYKKINK